jgi:ribonucleoside-diphosphate reductase alpha chain
MFVSFGLYPDGRPGEVFVDMSKVGTALRGWSSGVAMLVSIMLQHGITVREVAGALRDLATEPHPEVPVEGYPAIVACCGPLDFLARVMELEFPASASPPQ